MASREHRELDMRLWNVKIRLAVLAAILVIVTTGCAPSEPAGIQLVAAAAPRAAADPADATKAAAALNDFGLDFYRRVATGSGNVVVSPASIAIALSMARAGARGQTAAEMDAVLRAIGSDEHASWINALDAALASRSGTFKDEAGKDMEVTLRIANAPFVQRGLTLVPAYLEALGTRFGAGQRLVDFAHATEAARTAINAWVSDRTEHRIPELLAQGDLDVMTRLVLVNAIYLKAAWQTPFPADQTKPGTFTKLEGSTMDVPMMALGATLPYASGTGWRAVELPYVGGKLAMTIIVPDDLAAFQAGLDEATFATITGALSAQTVNLTMPRFGIETRADLATVLAGLGMPTAFNPDAADFSGMTTQERLYISAVIHQANIDVDEKGTEAAAATAVVMRATAAPSEPVTLHVDRPFLFALRDTQTGAVVFLGRVTEPAIR